MNILHGEDSLASYKRLNQLRDDYIGKGFQVNSFNAGELDLTKFRQVMEPSDLFGTPTLILITNPFSGVASKAKKSLLETLSTLQDKNVIIYQDKEITKANLDKFPQAKIEKFDLPKYIFNFLESLVPNNSFQIQSNYQKLDSDSKNPEYLLVMITRQIRSLIQIKTSPASFKGHPFVKQKLTNQSKLFSIDKLLDLHHQLVDIDIKVKSGQGLFDTSVYLEQFLTQI